jgi:chaperonin GroES
MANPNQTGMEFPIDDILGTEQAPAPIAQDPSLEVAGVTDAEVPVWASEQPVDDILQEGQTQADADLIPIIEKEVLRAEAVVLITNLAEKQSKETLADITTKVLEGYKVDLASRAEWEELNKQIIDLAKLIVKKKTYNGEIVANVKYPLIINACIQFAARAYPEIIKGNKVVTGKVVGADPQGIKLAKSQRVSEFMSFQLLNEMSDWEEGVDQLLFTLPAIGCVFKKSYFDSIERRNKSETVFADDLIVNYFTESLERAPRVTHRIYLYHNEIVERVTAGVFSQFDVAELGQAVSDKTPDVDDETPHLFLEQHRWYDLDNDGYQEPYIVTVHEQTQKLVRIAPRFASDGIIRKEGKNGKIIKIMPEQYFTRYIFMPSIDGGFYGMGFGSLLMSINSAVNTLVNQLLDAGTLSNRQSGFLGRGLKLGRGKSIQVKSGEWKPVDATGDDLRKNVFPMPVREPSGILFQLLGLMIESGKELASMTEILAGNSPGANVPAESVLALIEQGLQVYSAIHKRIHRAQYKEFTKLRRLNALYLDQMTYSAVLDEQAVLQEDFFNEDFDIIPVSDPNNTTMMQRMLKAKAMLELRGQGLNDQEILKRYLTAMDVEDVDSLIPEQTEEDPAEQMSLQKLQAELGELNEKIEKLKSETALNYAKIESEYSGQKKTDAGIVLDKDKVEIDAAQALNQIQLGRSAQSVGKAPGGITESTAKREYGLETNNQE